VSENTNMPAESGEVRMRDPKKYPPPRGTKLLILTSGGVTVVGDWIDTSNYVKWSPMPKKGDE
jgi:hypothetical protein